MEKAFPHGNAFLKVTAMQSLTDEKVDLMYFFMLKFHI